jgi:hypothetical protein
LRLNTFSHLGPLIADRVNRMVATQPTIAENVPETQPIAD